LRHFEFGSNANLANGRLQSSEGPRLLSLLMINATSPGGSCALKSTTALRAFDVRQAAFPKPAGVQLHLSKTDRN